MRDTLTRRQVLARIARIGASAALMGGTSRALLAVTPDSPSTIVRRFMYEHFKGDMAFTKASVEKKDHLMTPRFRRAALRNVNSTEPGAVPVIDGDPFTDSQQLPTSYEIGRATIRLSRARVPVQLRNASRTWSVTYLLLEDDDEWNIDDVELRNGSLLSALLR